MAVFGNTTAGNLSYEFCQYMYSRTYTLSEKAKVTKMTARLRGGLFGNSDVTLAIYNVDANGYPTSLVGYTETKTITDASLTDTDFNFATPVLLGAGNYALVIHSWNANPQFGFGYSKTILPNDALSWKGPLASSAVPSTFPTYPGGGALHWGLGGPGANSSEALIYATYTPLKLYPFWFFKR